MQADIVIKNGVVLTMDSSHALYEKADIAVSGDKIIDISPTTQYKAKKVIDAQNKLVMPGLINTHTHAAMTLLRGVADDMPLDIWWQKYIFPLEKKFVDKEFVRIGVELAAAEMIKSGTTSFADMYFFEDVAADACKKIGIRAFLGEGVLDFPTPDSKTPEESLRYIKELHKKWKEDALINIVVAPHAPYSCGRENLLKSKALADELNVPLHIHVSETEEEVAQSKKKHGMSPVEFLDNIGFLSEKIIAVHCVHLSDKDIEILKKRKVKVAHCQESNMKLASGFAPIVELQDQGITVGLATDGAASNNNLDMFDEMDSVAKFHKAVRRDPTVMNAKNVVRMATAEGAKVLQRPDIGSLEIGKKADIIIIDMRLPHLTPVYNIYSHLVYSAGGSDVVTSIINGKLVMENRTLLTANENGIINRANRFSEKIRSEALKDQAE